MLFEILLWDIVYLAVYLPASFALKAYTGKGDAFGILLIGGMCTAILPVILAFQEECVFDSGGKSEVMKSALFLGSLLRCVSPCV